MAQMLNSCSWSPENITIWTTSNCLNPIHSLNPWQIWNIDNLVVCYWTKHPPHSPHIIKHLTEPLFTRKTLKGRCSMDQHGQHPLKTSETFKWNIQVKHSSETFKWNIQVKHSLAFELWNNTWHLCLKTIDTHKTIPSSQVHNIMLMKIWKRWTKAKNCNMLGIWVHRSFWLVLRAWSKHNVNIYDHTTLQPLLKSISMA
jgi:hypothetical protein